MTDTGIPDGVAVETIYVVEVSYAADAPAKRPGRPPRAPVADRPAHGRRAPDRGRRVPGLQLGAVPRAGGDEGEAIDLIRDDVYMRAGVWIDDVRARPFGRVVLAPERT